MQRATFLVACFLLHVAFAVAVTSDRPAPGTEAAGRTRDVVSPDMDLLASYLQQLVRNDETWTAHEPPLLYVEDNSGGSEEDDTLELPWKRSRYYRRYPWKRQNGRHRTQYEDAGRYMCNPTREDVFQLLVALHDARQGNIRRTVNFCNRKRPASAIFTNIRFLGRRK